MEAEGGSNGNPPCQTERQFSAPQQSCWDVLLFNLPPTHSHVLCQEGSKVKRKIVSMTTLAINKSDLDPLEEKDGNSKRRMAALSWAHGVAVEDMGYQVGRKARYGGIWVGSGHWPASLHVLFSGLWPSPHSLEIHSYSPQGFSPCHVRYPSFNMNNHLFLSLRWMSSPQGPRSSWCPTPRSYRASGYAQDASSPDWRLYKDRTGACTAGQCVQDTSWNRVHFCQGQHAHI